MDLKPARNDPPDQAAIPWPARAAAAAWRWLDNGGTFLAAVIAWALLQLLPLPAPASSTSPRQRRKTSWAVRAGDVASRWLITVGGIGTIVAVIAVFVFLLYIVFPLFQAAEVTSPRETRVDWSKTLPVQLGVDEDQLMCWALFPDGRLQLLRLDTGGILEERDLFVGGPRLTATSFAPGKAEVVFGFADGSFRIGKIRFATSYLEPAQLPKAIRDVLDPTAEPAEMPNPLLRKTARLKNGMVVRTPQKQYRLEELVVDLDKPTAAPQKSAVVLIDRTLKLTGAVTGVLTADGKLRLHIEDKIPRFDGGEPSVEMSGIDLPYVQPPDRGVPSHLFVSPLGDQLYLFWKDGHLIRFDARDRRNPQVAETRNVLEDRALRVTAVRCLLGKETFLVGDSSGRVRCWFYTPAGDGADRATGKMVNAHEFGGPASVAALCVSDRSRMAAVSYLDGNIRLIYITSERRMAEFATTASQPAGLLVLAPKDDGLIAATASRLWNWAFDPRHPEVTPAALLAPVWYEGYDRPQYKWQSSGATDAPELKFSLVPLIYGTLKASFYALLFGVPIALLAAIYTSEFLHPRLRAVIKPTIELMATLPSVVLGFLAALVFSQFVADALPAVLACALTLPLAFLTGAYLWQLLPTRLAGLLNRWRFPFICLCVPVGLLGALSVGPVLEGLLFAGDLRGWIDRRAGSGVGGWVFLLLPLSAITSGLLVGRVSTPRLKKRTRIWTRSRTGFLDLARFAVVAGVSVGLAWVTALVLNLAGLDPRDSFMGGTYSSENALVVGLFLGFAIIPIVYTIAEDALSAIPEHLRAGSLAAGATPWQTATYIIIPTAASGLFSAVMIGLGRAVGETMIVLMAGGNTPIMNGSMFTGFRTLSANIATELPEAVQNSTHYRILFLSALALFALTFVLNTIAELIRLRFRRRTYQL